MGSIQDSITTDRTHEGFSVRWKCLEAAELHNRLGIQIVELGYYRCFRGYILV